MCDPLHGTDAVPDKKPKPSPKDPGPGFFSRIREGASTMGVDGARSAFSKVLVAGVLITVCVGWIVGRGPLERHVASISAQPLKVRVEWPMLAGERGTAPKSWVPAPVQNELEQIVKQNISPNPFDQASLVDAAERLRSTGWFARLEEVRREAGGVVSVKGTWRVQAAIVRKDGRNHLVAIDGAVLKLPAGVPPQDRLFNIYNPSSPPPASELGGIAYGEPWRGSDVQSAIALLKLLYTRPAVARQVDGVDLGEFARSGKLTLVTDRQHRIVWGSPIGELLPGEVTEERKVMALEKNLKEWGRIDANEQRLEIYTPIVLVDKTARDVPAE